jgi:hypothetical protein
MLRRMSKIEHIFFYLTIVLQNNMAQRSNPVFLVLPSVVVFDDPDNAQYCIMEPVLGKYEKSTSGIVSTGAGNVAKINDKIMLVTSGKQYWELQDLYNHSPVIRIPAPSDYLISYNFIEWPIYKIGNRKCSYIFDMDMTFKRVDLDIPLNSIITSGIIHDPGTLDVLCELNEGESFLYKSRDAVYKGYFDKSRHSKLIKYDQLSDDPWNDLRAAHKIKNNLIWVETIGNGLITNWIADLKANKVLQIRCGSFSFYNIIYDDLCMLYRSNSESNQLMLCLFLVNDDLDISSEKWDEDIDLMEIGNIIIDLPTQAFAKRVIENPFKTKERDCLASWLHSQFGQLLPLPIAGIITEYCTLVKYWDYDVLMKHIESQKINRTA